MCTLLLLVRNKWPDFINITTRCRLSCRCTGRLLLNGLSSVRSPQRPRLSSTTSNCHQQGSKVSMTSIPDASPPLMVDDHWCPLLQHRLVLSKHPWHEGSFPKSQWFNHWCSLQCWTVVCSLSWSPLWLWAASSLIKTLPKFLDDCCWTAQDCVCVCRTICHGYSLCCAGWKRLRDLQLYHSICHGTLSKNSVLYWTIRVTGHQPWASRK